MKIKCCQGCKDRFNACHDTCVRYTAECLVMDGIKGSKNEESLLGEYRADRKTRYERRKRNKG